MNIHLLTVDHTDDWGQVHRSGLAQPLHALWSFAHVSIEGRIGEMPYQKELRVLTLTANDRIKSDSHIN